jgi:hypothetical protein
MALQHHLVSDTNSEAKAAADFSPGRQIKQRAMANKRTRHRNGSFSTIVTFPF